ncbi:ATP-binding protein [Pseudobutyrivibrio ruminis]|uniref:ATP-binding protein n=1 Tax=Pseudobutyrivibrio ruminis TaxID=46206 RepID=UPI00068D3157|nr:ATP-binding protein [Pseudobutyrivibrio ruminis]
MKSVYIKMILIVTVALFIVVGALLASVAVISDGTLSRNQFIKLIVVFSIFLILAIIVALKIAQNVIKEINSMNEFMQRQLDAVDSASKAKSQFLASMSHEVRTPINAILGMNEMIIRESSDEQIVEYATNVKQAGKALLAQVNSILDYSKLEEGKMDIIQVEYDLATMINGFVTSVATRAKSKGLRMEVNVDTNLPTTLLGDDVRLGQVINNLLTNAVKYTEVGVITLNIWEESREDGAIDIGVSVQDTGIGIKPEDMEKLSASFTRIEEERNRNIEGTGLGIPIVIEILRLMGSDLKVESVYGQGSTFSFVIRQGIINDEPLGDYRKRVKRSYRRRNKYTYPSMPKANIIVVDDYEMNLVVAKNLMKVYDFIPDLAESGPEAVTRIEEKHYDIIFMDHMMPDMDGVETLEILKKRQMIDESTAVIALTANAIAGAKDFYISKGFNDYLTKPIDAEALEQVLTKYVPAEKIVKKSISDIKNNKSLTVNDDERKALIKIFVSTIQETAKNLDSLLEAEDIKNYTIKVHGLKSTARLIGEMSISSKAEALEKAGNENDWDYIKSHHKELIREYLSLENSYKEVKETKKKLDAGELKDAIYSIIEMASVCDYTSTEMVIDSLDEYEMPENVESEMKHVRELLQKLDYEGVVGLAKNMLNNGGN